MVPLMERPFFVEIWCVRVLYHTIKYLSRLRIIDLDVVVNSAMIIRTTSVLRIYIDLNES